MPVSKRDKVVSISKVKPQSKEARGEFVAKLEESLRQFRFVHVIRVENDRNCPLKEFRESVKPGKLFMTKCALLRVGLSHCVGAVNSEAYETMSELVSGTCGLLCTDKPASEILALANECRPSEFARPGSMANVDVRLVADEKPLHGFTVNMESQFRELGMPVQVKNAKIELLSDFQVCSMGEPLTSKACRLLKILKVQSDEMRINVAASFDFTAAKLEVHE